MGIFDMLYAGRDRKRQEVLDGNVRRMLTTSGMSPAEQSAAYVSYLQSPKGIDSSGFQDVLKDYRSQQQAAQEHRYSLAQEAFKARLPTDRHKNLATYQQMVGQIPAMAQTRQQFENSFADTALPPEPGTPLSPDAYRQMMSAPNQPPVPYDKEILQRALLPAGMGGQNININTAEEDMIYGPGQVIPGTDIQVPENQYFSKGQMRTIIKESIADSQMMASLETLGSDYAAAVSLAFDAKGDLEKMGLAYNDFLSFLDGQDLLSFVAKPVAIAVRAYMAERPEFQRIIQMNTWFNKEMPNVIKFYSGAAVSQQEMDRLTRAFKPSSGDTKQSVFLRTYAIQDWVRRIKNRRQTRPGQLIPVRTLEEMIEQSMEAARAHWGVSSDSEGSDRPQGTTAPPVAPATPGATTPSSPQGGAQGEAWGEDEWEDF